MNEALTYNIALENKTGWMTPELFHSVFQHIINHTKSNSILVLMDKHELHCLLGATLIWNMFGQFDDIYTPFKAKCGLQRLAYSKSRKNINSQMRSTALI